MFRCLETKSATPARKPRILVTTIPSNMEVRPYPLADYLLTIVTSSIPGLVLCEYLSLAVFVPVCRGPTFRKAACNPTVSDVGVSACRARETETGIPLCIELPILSVFVFWEVFGLSLRNKGCRAKPLSMRMATRLASMRRDCVDFPDIQLGASRASASSRAFSGWPVARFSILETVSVNI